MNSRIAGAWHRWAPCRGVLCLALVGLLPLQTGADTHGSSDGRELPPPSMSPIPLPVPPSVDPLDLNHASSEQVRSLPVPTEIQDAIIDHLVYQGPFRSFYELREIPGLTQDHLLALHPLVAIYPSNERDAEVDRIDGVYDRLSRLASSEGANEALIDAYVDQLRVPLPVARATEEDLQSIPGVSPIDAAAIVRHLERGSKITSSRELRRVSGLSHYGWRSVRDYLRYDPVAGGQLGGDIQVRMTRPLLDTDALELLHEDFDPTDNDTTSAAQSVRDAYALLGLDEALPSVTTKARVRYGRDVDVGFITHRRPFEADLAATLKGYAGLRDQEWGPFRVHRAIFGNYSISLGQGLVLENTDFYRPRKSGLTYDKRTQGILGDVGRTDEHAFLGAAADISWGKFRAVGFVSQDQRDAVIDSTGFVRSLITMDLRVASTDFPDSLPLHPDHPESEGVRIEKDALKETTWGGSLRYHFAPGTHIGINGYESLYDRFFLPSFAGIVNQDDLDLISPIDDEFLTANLLDGRYRRIYGIEGQFVWENMLGQFEYGNQLGGGDAWIATGFAQWSNLNLLLSYRDYDVDYGNPYNRAFSEKPRYDDTLLEDPYRLTNPLLSQIALGSAQPAPEQGVYLSTRYQLTRQILATVDYSTWRRKTDGATFKRLVPRVQYSPTWPVRIEWRHKWQTRNEEAAGDAIEVSQTIEDRFRMRMFLSNRNTVEFLYHIGHTRWPPRGRLAGVVDGGPAYRDSDPDEGSPLQGSVTEPTTALSAVLTHKMNDRIKVRAGVTAFNGFFWNWEDTEFLVADGEGTRTWISVWDRLSDHLSLYLKVAWHRENPTNWRDARKYNGEYEFGSFDNDAPLELRESTQFRLQMDYAW